MSLATDSSFQRDVTLVSVVSTMLNKEYSAPEYREFLHHLQVDVNYSPEHVHRRINIRYKGWHVSTTIDDTRQMQDMVQQVEKFVESAAVRMLMYKSELGHYAEEVDHIEPIRQKFKLHFGNGHTLEVSFPLSDEDRAGCQLLFDLPSL